MTRTGEVGIAALCSWCSLSESNLVTNDHWSAKDCAFQVETFLKLQLVCFAAILTSIIISVPTCNKIKLCDQNFHEMGRLFFEENFR
jgi:hypothetical protein